MGLRGAKSVKQAVHRILEQLFTNSIPAEYNWTGKNRKHSLKSFDRTILFIQRKL